MTKNSQNDLIIKDRRYSNKKVREPESINIHLIVVETVFYIYPDVLHK